MTEPAKTWPAPGDQRHIVDRLIPDAANAVYREQKRDLLRLLADPEIRQALREAIKEPA